LAAAAILTLVAVGCGDDDDDATGATGDKTAENGGGSGSGKDDAAYCDASLAVETAPEPDIDFPTATEEEIAAGFKAWADETMRPLVKDAVAASPAKIKADAEIMQDALEQMAAGDPSAFDVPDVVAAENRIHQYDLDTCGWESHAVSATEYMFKDLPDELPAGVTSFELTNEGKEVHELILVRKNPGVTDSAQDLLALPEEEAMAKVTMLGSPAFAPPGDSDYKVVDLERGDYIAVCFIPKGMTSDDGPPPDGPPHFTQGMVAEFTVT
jgi:hypothetical protein